MIPEQRLSTELVVGEWLSPDNLENSALIDYELGGVGLNDPSEGLRVQIWTLFKQGDDVMISAPNTLATVLFTAPTLTQLSLAFDQNMRPFVSFTEGGVAKYWWYDTDVPGLVTTTLPVGALYPVACLDDKRETQTFSSDIIMVYTIAGSLYFRAQRDRYLTDYLLTSNLSQYQVCKRVGMSSVNRLNFLVRVL